jgi:hypothetical protein
MRGKWWNFSTCLTRFFPAGVDEVDGVAFEAEQDGREFREVKITPTINMRKKCIYLHTTASAAGLQQHLT